MACSRDRHSPEASRAKVASRKRVEIRKLRTDHPAMVVMLLVIGPFRA